MTETAIALQGVVKRSGNLVGLEGISANVEAGELVGVVGPDGAGKTALCRIVAGLLRPDAGSVAVFGHDAVRDTAAIQAITGYVPQRFGLVDELSVLENLALHAALRSITGEMRRARIGEVLDLTDLARAGASRAGTLSSGAKRKLELGCALIGRPRLVILDQPSIGIDIIASRELVRLVQDLAIEGLTVLWSTASFAEAEHCSRVLLLKEGRLLDEGRPADLKARLSDRTHAVAATGRQRHHVAGRLLAMPGIGDVQIRATTVRFLTETPEGDSELRRFLGIGPVKHVAPRLEDCFIARLPGSTARTPPPPQAPAGAGVHAPVIEVKGLTKRFGRIAAVDRLDFAVSRGEIFGLCGPNGAGKTTILRILCGLLTPTEGEVRVAGTGSDAMPRPPRPRLGYMTEKFSLYGELSVAQNLHFFAAACKIDRSRRRDYVTELLAEHGLASYANKRAAMLPAAAKQLLSLAVALVSQPEIVLLDEPTAGVDPLIRRDIWRRAERLAGRGVTVIVASENMDEMPACDRLLLLYRGQCIAIGKPDELLPRQAAGDDAESMIEDAFVSFIEARKQRDVA